MSDETLPRGWAHARVELLGEPSAPILYGILQPGPDIPDGIPYVRPTEIAGDKIQFSDLRRTTPAIAARYTRSVLATNDIIMSMVGTIGKVALVPAQLEGGNITQSSVRIRADQRLVRHEFLAWYLRSPVMFRQFEAKRLGTAVPRLNVADIRNLIVCFPPLAEQKRIVAKIEELFSELEAGEESLRVARRQLGVYRQSLLKQAFEGKLTAKWRTQNAAKDSAWISTTVGKIGRIETGTTPPTENQANYGGDLPFFKPTDLEQGRYVKTARSHLSAAGQQSARVLPAGTVLVTCIGATIGKTGLAQLACATNQQINSISPAEDLSPEFAYFQVISPQFQEQIKTNASSTTLPILNKSKFSALPFVRCSLSEQQEIVRVLDEQFEGIDRNEREINGALRSSAALRQAILKKAFTGRLVPHDPSDEPATALLARIRADRTATPKPARPRIGRPAVAR